MSAPPFALDTSFLVRLLTRHPVRHFEVAAAFLDRWHEGDVGLIVSDLALAESYFALQYHYGFEKADALESLRRLAQHPAIDPSPHARGVLSLPDLASAKPGFVDRLIHGSALEGGRTLVTFEKSARKLPGTLVLEA